MQYCRRESCEPRLGRKRTRKRGLAGVCGVTGSSSSSVNRWCLRAAEAEVPLFVRDAQFERGGPGRHVGCVLRPSSQPLLGEVCEKARR